MSTHSARSLWGVSLLFSAVLLASFFSFVSFARADTDPLACSANGVGLSLTVYRANGTTPVGGGSIAAGETVKYEATLSHLGGNNCNYEGGTLSITTPDGVVHVVASPATPVVPLVTSGSPFVSSQVSYVANSAHVGGDGDLDSAADYSGGISHTGTNHDTASAHTDLAKQFVAALVVEKTVNTTFDRDWDWTINKTGSDTNLNLQENEQVSVNYTVVVAPTSENINHAVSGNITITNPVGNPSATIATVTDVLNVSGAAIVSCPGGLPQALAAGQSLICTYTKAAASANDTQNTATVGTTGSVPGGNDSEAVSYGSPVNETDECVTVDDTNPQGPQDVVVCQNTADKSLEYSVTFGPQGNVVTSCGQGDLHNVADFETNDNLEVGNDTWDVHWVVNCSVGCTLTQGYWKTHNDSFKGGAPTDAGWLEIGASKEQTGFFTNAEPTYPVAGPNTPPFSWFKVFQTPPKGNVYYNLAHQYMAAKLNILNGAGPTPAVSAAITAAEDLFDSTLPATAAGLKGGAKNTWTSLAGTLGSFNEGSIGPGHCDEQNP